MTIPTPHTVELVELSPTRWRSVCSCGYRSSGYAYPKGAKNAGDQHLRARKLAVG